ncbi:MAG TPA: hypothetical protein VJ652_15015 [Noviherbaspirillum sp.]|nr:hypothetical protein [Noviherbaspirillum sp.]
METESGKLADDVRETIDRLLNTIVRQDALIDKLTQWKQIVSDPENQPNQLREPKWAFDEIDRLQAENEAMRKDAERYRWLREADWFRTGIANTETNATAYHLIHERLDRTIDTEMEKQ